MKIKKFFEYRYVRFWFALTVIVLALLISFLPKPKYKSPQIISSLKIPLRTENWVGKDISSNIEIRDERFNFVSDVLARVYRNRYKEELMFIVLDAGNFHHPKVCFGASGFTVRELNEVIIPLAGRKIEAKAVYVQKGNESYVVMFWMCINKKITDWTEQKFRQLLFSLFNKKKTGLMVRLDIPVKGEQIDYAIARGADFLTQISDFLPSEQQAYLFGQK